MFSLVTGVYDAYFSPPKLNLLLVGAAGSGKTTLLERCKVTQFTHSKKTAINLQQPQTLPLHVFLGEASATTASAASNGKRSDAVEVPILPNRKPAVVKSRWLCPAPQKYTVTLEEDDDNDDDDDEKEDMHPLAGVGTRPPIPGTANLAERKTSTQGSMESVELGHGTTASLPRSSFPATPSTATATATSKTQYDLRPGAKMLPFSRIRPTIGMNLAKNLDVCGARINVLDLGGRLVSLWDRYYSDCDAVIFAWKVQCNIHGQNDQYQQQQQTETDNNGDSDDDERPEITSQMQLRLLEKVRSSIPDDIPFLILGHFDSPDVLSDQCRPDTLYSTAQLLPHYHNPCQALYFCNAGTGQGVRSAMEWLIPLAKRQQAIRDRSSIDSSLDKK